MKIQTLFLTTNIELSKLDEVVAEIEGVKEFGMILKESDQNTSE